MAILRMSEEDNTPLYEIDWWIIGRVIFIKLQGEVNVDVVEAMVVDLLALASPAQPDHPLQVVIDARAYARLDQGLFRLSTLMQVTNRFFDELKPTCVIFWDDNPNVVIHFLLQLVAEAKNSHMVQADTLENVHAALLKFDPSLEGKL